MLVKILGYDTGETRSVSQAEHDLIEYLNSGWAKAVFLANSKIVEDKHGK